MSQSALWMRQTVPGDRGQYRRWLLMADEPDALARYLYEGVLWTFGVGIEMVAAVLMLASEEGAMDIKNMAVAPLWQGRGVGQQVLEKIADYYRAHGYRALTVGTANSSLSNLAFYQKAGFRLVSIRQDFFTPAHGYPERLSENGIEMRDMVQFTRHLDVEETR